MPTPPTRPKTPEFSRPPTKRPAKHPTKPHANRLVLIPAAGFGRRVGSPPAKELLTPVEFHGLNFIDHALGLCREWQARALVVVRQNKTELINHLRQTSSPDWVSCFEIESSKEWADTCRQAVPALAAHNLLLLPDTQFAPEDIGAKLFAMIEGPSSTGLALATFATPTPQVWGCFRSQASRSLIAEKPKGETNGALAWGLMAFHQGLAKDLFSAIQLSHETGGKWQTLPATVEPLALDHFVDLTRGD